MRFIKAKILVVLSFIIIFSCGEQCYQCTSYSVVYVLETEYTHENTFEVCGTRSDIKEIEGTENIPNGFGGSAGTVTTKCRK